MQQRLKMMCQSVMMSSSTSTLHKELLHKAVQLLAQRSHSSYELNNKLRVFSQKKYIHQEYEPEIVQTTIRQVIDHCLTKKWLNEDDFIEQYITMRARRGYGPNRIVLELQQRGIDKSAVQRTLAEQNIDWIELGLAQMLKKFRVIDKNNRQQQGKVFQFLSYKGFSQEQIKFIYSSIV